MSCGGDHPNRKEHHKHLSAEAKKKISLALKGKKHHHKGHPTSLATKRKISAALKCRAAERGTCRPVKPETAHRIEKRLIKSLHTHPSLKPCKASSNHRHSKAGARRTAHIHRHVTHHVKRDQRQRRKENMPRWEHLVHTLPAKRGRRLLRLEREWRKRERHNHKARLNCHVKARHSTGKGTKKHPQCPHGRKRGGSRVKPL